MRFRLAILVSILVVLIGSWGVAQPAAAALIYNTLEPFTDDFDACTGEVVVVTGTQRIVERVTEDRTGQLHISFTRHTQGTGIGTVSGDEYVFIDSVVRSQLTVSPDEIGQVFTEGYEAMFIHKGESAGDDNIAHFLTHITVNPDGTMTSTVEIESQECR